MSLSYRIVRAFCRLFLVLVSRMQVDGVERIPKQGPLIVVANHLHLLDVFVLISVIPMQVTVLAAEKWERRPIVSLAFKAVGAVFVNRGEPDRKALRKIEEALRRGAVVGIAPEGTRSLTGALQAGKRGAAYLASKTGATVVPIVAYGQERVFTRLRRLRRGDICVKVGDPFTLPPAERSEKHKRLEGMTLDIMLRIARLLPPEYQGIYRRHVLEEAD